MIPSYTSSPSLVYNSTLHNEEYGNGLNFREGAMVNMWMAEQLELSSYQSRCLKGRMSKRIRKANFEGKESLIRQYPQIYGGSAFDIAVYEIDKYLHLSGFMA